MNETQDRTEAATPRKLARARARGRNAHSPLAAAALAIAVTALPVLAIPSAYGWWSQAFARAVDAASTAREGSISALLASLHVAIWQPGMWSIIGLAALGSALAAVSTAAACGALGFSPGALAPTWSRLAWSSGFSQVLPRGAPAQACLTVACIAVVAWAMAPAVETLLRAAWACAMLVPTAAALGEALRTTWLRAALCLAVFGAADIVLARRRFAGMLKMSVRELRDDRAETEGRPEMKARRRNLAARNRAVSVSAVRRATAVVTNPTHVAVALRYAPPAIDVPIVVSRGADHTALAVRAEADRYAVPIIESPDLARSLYASVELGEPIPEECYSAVAAIFVWILRTRGVLAGREDGA